MNEYNFNVNFEKGRITSNLKKLVQNDYNSTKINFTFDKEGRKVFKMLLPDGTPYVTDIENDELIFGKGVLSQDGTYEVEITLYTEDGRLTDYATVKFVVRAELIQTDEIIELDDRLPILDNLITEVMQIKTDVDNGEFDGATPTIGENGNWVIDGADTGLPSQGERGKAGSVKFIVANELPTENIDESAIYMLPTSSAEENNMYDEYIYVNGAWENIGGASVEVDLTNYFNKEEVKTITGELESLSTEVKDNLVNAINEVASNSGGIPHLVNETITLYNHEPGIYLLSGKDTTIKYKYNGIGTHKPFANDQITGYLFCVRANAINQGYGILLGTAINYTKINSYTNTSYTSVEIENIVTSSQTGILSTLKTNDKSTLVKAINEVFDLSNEKASTSYVDDAIASAIEALKAELGAS